VGHGEAKKCGRPVCHETFHIYTIVPSSALGVKMSKPNYPYFGIDFTTGSGIPSPPRWLYLNAGHASMSSARKISAGEFENTLTFSFTIGDDGIYWDWTGRTKDAGRHILIVGRKDTDSGYRRRRAAWIFMQADLPGPRLAWDKPASRSYD
jgi:hypothetical protein